MNALHTLKDTLLCTAVLAAMLVGTLSGAYVAFNETPVAATAFSQEA